MWTGRVARVRPAPVVPVVVIEDALGQLPAEDAQPPRDVAPVVRSLEALGGQHALGSALLSDLGATHAANGTRNPGRRGSVHHARQRSLRQRLHLPRRGATQGGEDVAQLAPEPTNLLQRHVAHQAVHRARRHHRLLVGLVHRRPDLAQEAVVGDPRAARERELLAHGAADPGGQPGPHRQPPVMLEVRPERAREDVRAEVVQRASVVRLEGLWVQASDGVLHQGCDIHVGFVNRRAFDRATRPDHARDDRHDLARRPSVSFERHFLRSAVPALRKALQRVEQGCRSSRPIEARAGTAQGRCAVHQCIVAQRTDASLSSSPSTTTPFSSMVCTWTSRISGQSRRAS